jgi:hypothetical protein
MPQPYTVSNLPIITNASMAANITSLTTDVTEVLTYSIQGSWSGTSPVGTINIFVSDDAQATPTLLTTYAVASNTGNFMYNEPKCGYTSVQVTYTHSSGTGTMNARVVCKRNG